MSDIRDLQVYIENENPLAFLTEYLNLSIEGYNTPIPSSLELSGIKEGWQQILSDNFGQTPSHFIEELGLLWQSAIKKQGGQINETFARDMLAILSNDKPDNKQEVKSKVSEQPQAGYEGQPSFSGTYTQSVSSSISDDYRTFQEITRSGSVSVDKINKGINSAIAALDESDFLFYYLSQAKIGKTPEVPMELSHNAINQAWERIITFELGTYVPEFFLAKITNLWVNLVHSYGPVTSKDSVLYILEQFEIKRAKTKKNVPDVKPVSPALKKNWLSGLLGKFRI